MKCAENNDVFKLSSITAIIDTEINTEEIINIDRKTEEINEEAIENIEMNNDEEASK